MSNNKLKIYRFHPYDLFDHYSQESSSFSQNFTNNFQINSYNDESLYNLNIILNSNLHLSQINQNLSNLNINLLFL